MLIHSCNEHNTVMKTAKRSTTTSHTLSKFNKVSFRFCHGSYRQNNSNSSYNNGQKNEYRTWIHNWWFDLSSSKWDCLFFIFTPKHTNIPFFHGLLGFATRFLYKHANQIITIILLHYIGAWKQLPWITQVTNVLIKRLGDQFNHVERPSTRCL